MALPIGDGMPPELSPGMEGGQRFLAGGRVLDRGSGCGGARLRSSSSVGI